ncbi:MAG TPA: hypothetical protein VK176_13220 [Phycisphaerales bacterium]|nr:hypothetical protein [Phycisphaerales bacterium]
MHDETAEGNAFFKCDFCLKPWAEDRPMVEGHRGSLICGPCLTVAYAEVVLHQMSTQPPEGAVCTLCLEPRKDPHWRSPVRPDAHACLRCIKQSARVFEKDPESGWKRPG